MDPALFDGVLDPRFVDALNVGLLTTLFLLMCAPWVGLTVWWLERHDH